MLPGKCFQMILDNDATDYSRFGAITKNSSTTYLSAGDKMILFYFFNYNLYALF